MTTFTDRWRQLNWDDIALRINSKTPVDVERALNARHLTRDDLMALLSPAASAYLEPMAQRAQRLTRQRFGNTVSFYVPLYLSNLCANDCTYCGFSMSNRIKRKTLDKEEIARECAAIREMGFEHLLLVTGEHQAKSEWTISASTFLPFVVSSPRCRWKCSPCRRMSMRSSKRSDWME